MSLPFNKLRIFGKQILNHIIDEGSSNSLNKVGSIYTIIKSDELMKILTSRLSETDIYKVVFITFLMNKGEDISKIEDIVSNDLLLFKLTNYDEPSTKRESCDECDGYGNIECDSCDGDGDIICNNCSGSGEVDCDECGGSGEDEEGDTCHYCDGGGTKPCDDCNGDGRNECSFCDGNGQNSCDYCDGSGEVETDEEYYDRHLLTFITTDDYVLSVKEDTILPNDVVDKLFDSDSFYVRSYISDDDTLDDIESQYEGEPEDKSDFYILTSPPIKL
jgi:hypothetical protein